MWLYLASDLTATQQQLEEDEALDVVRIGPGEAIAMIAAGQIQDAKTMIGLLLAGPRLGSPFLEVNYPHA